MQFFNTAGIPSPTAATYAHVFVENRIRIDMLLDLNKDYLREMGIQAMGDVIAILRHAKNVSEQTARDRVLSNSAEVKTYMNQNQLHRPLTKSVVVNPMLRRRSDSLEEVKIQDVHMTKSKKKEGICECWCVVFYFLTDDPFPHSILRLGSQKARNF